jgi:hypothetical protein
MTIDEKLTPETRHLNTSDKLHHSSRLKQTPPSARGVGTRIFAVHKSATTSRAWSRPLREAFLVPLLVVADLRTMPSARLLARQAKGIAMFIHDSRFESMIQA